MSLKFLSKKSWHTTTLNNVERVWIAEQKAEKESRKLAELQKQITEERQIKELRELQSATGQAVANVDTSMDWMYQGPAAEEKQYADDYLLGKTYSGKGKPEAAGSAEAEAGEAASLSVTAKTPGATWMNKVSAKNDTFTRLHEDPMLQIRRTEKEARDQVVNNPVKMARIRQQLGQVEELFRQQQRTEESSNSDCEDAKRQSSRKHHKHHKHHKHRRDEREKKRKRKRSRSSSPQPVPVSETSSSSSAAVGRGERGEDGSKRARNTSEGDVSPQRVSTNRDHDRDRESRGGDRDRESRGRDRDRDRDRDCDRESRGGNGAERRAGYGLVNKNPAGGGSGGGKSLESLVEERRRKEEKEQDELRKDKRARHSAQSALRSGQLSVEEKARRLAEMQADAGLNEEMRTSRLIKAHYKDRERLSVPGQVHADLPVKLGGNSAEGSGSSAAFLQDMRQEVYAAGDGSLAERLQQNKHYVQRGVDLDQNSHGGYRKN